MRITNLNNPEDLKALDIPTVILFSTAFLTTMLAFGSMVFSIWRGFGQLGGALFLGVGACFLTTVIILPGIIGAIMRKNQK